jgi:hypothetical protein
MSLSQVTYLEYALSLAPYETQLVSVNFSFMRLLASSGVANDVSAIFGLESVETPLTGVGIGLGFADVVQGVKFRNKTAGTITLTVAFSNRLITDDRLNVSGTINTNVLGTVTTTVSGTVDTSLVSPTTIPSQADVSCAATSTTLVLAANSSRQDAIISNLVAGGAIVRCGDSSVGASRGIEIPVGGSVVLTTTAAIYVYNPSASAIYIGRSETA